MLDSVWSRLLVALEPRIQVTALESWMRPCRLASIDGDRLRVAAPNDFVRDWLARHHLDALRAAARDVLGGDPRVTIAGNREVPRLEAAAARITATPAPLDHEALPSPHTFGDFVRGHSNHLRQAAG